MSLAVSPTEGGNLFVSGSCDSTAKVWDIRSEKCTHTFHGHQSDINSVTFFPDGRAFGEEQDLYGVLLKNTGICMAVDFRIVELVVVVFDGWPWHGAGLMLTYDSKDRERLPRTHGEEFVLLKVC